MILPIYEHLQQENRRLRRINAAMLSALKDIAIGCGKSTLSRDAMRERAFDALAFVDVEAE